MTTQAERPISIAASIQADQEPSRVRRLRNILAALGGRAPCPLCQKRISPEAIDGRRFEFNGREELIHADCAEIVRASRHRESHTVRRDAIQEFHLRPGEEDLIFEVLTSNGQRVCMSGPALERIAETRREADAIRDAELAADPRNTSLHRTRPNRRGPEGTSTPGTWGSGRRSMIKHGPTEPTGV